MLLRRVPGESEGKRSRQLKGMRMRIKITTASGGYRTKLYGDNGEQMFVSEVYTTKASALYAANVVKTQAAAAQVIDETVSP